MRCVLNPWICSILHKGLYFRIKKLIKNTLLSLCLLPFHSYLFILFIYNIQTLYWNINLGVLVVRCDDSFVRTVKMTGCMLRGSLFVFLQSLQYHNCQYDCQHRSSTPVMDCVVARLFSPTAAAYLLLVPSVTYYSWWGTWAHGYQLKNYSFQFYQNLS